MNRVLLADAVGRRPASSDFALLLSSSFKYGLTLGTEKADNISLTELGIAMVKPRDEAERIRASRNAALAPELFRRIYDHYNNGKLPQGEFFLNVLERDFQVPRARCKECADMVVDNGRFVGIIRELQGSLYVVVEGEVPSDTRAAELDYQEPDDQTTPSDTPPAPGSALRGERYIFIGHGRNRKPLDQLERVLKQFGIAYKIATDEPQMARPISEKVAQVMRECHSAILIFTADEEFQTQEGQSVWRPSQNVIYELGAASVLYGPRIVIFKEDDLEFPTNFRDVGYISFERDRLDAKGVDLVKELIALGLVKVQPA